jgi:hypothetical protein
MRARRQLTLLCLALLPSLRAQTGTTLFREGFAAGIPPTWSQQVLDVPIDPWSAGISPANGSPDVFHEWFCSHGGQNRHNVLISPPIDLRGFTRVDFVCAQHQEFPLLRSVNRVEVTLDAGQTFSLIYQETGTWSGPGTIQANLDAFAGRADVRIAFRYEGAVANEWRVDDVQVTSPQPTLAVQGLLGGSTATFGLAGAAPGGLVVYGLSLAGPGPIPSPWGSVGMTFPIDVLAVQVASGTGAAATTLALPPSAVGVAVWTQALVFAASGEVVLSNAVAQVVL